MSFARHLLPALHLLNSLHLIKICDGSLPSLEMKDLLFIERRSHTAYDLVLEFYNRTLLPSCDFTANACDINCCNDKDCNEESLEAFLCKRVAEQFTVDPILSDSMYCHSNGTSTDPVLCYETENSPFLGVYFEEDRILKRKLVELKLENILQDKYFTLPKPERTLRGAYKYGVPLTLSGKDDLVYLPSDVLGKGYCDYHSSVRFLEDKESICTSEINPEQCTNNPKFQLQTYFKERRGELEPLKIFSGSESPLVVNVTLHCGRDIFDIEDFHAVNDVIETCGNATKIRRTDYDAGVCKHVVTRIELNFVWEGDALVAGDAAVVLSDVSTSESESRVPSGKRRGPRVRQTFATKFHREVTPSTRRHDSYDANDEILLHHVS